MAICVTMADATVWMMCPRICKAHCRHTKLAIWCGRHDKSVISGGRATLFSSNHHGRKDTHRDSVLVTSYCVLISAMGNFVLADRRQDSCLMLLMKHGETKRHEDANKEKIARGTTTETSPGAPLVACCPSVHSRGRQDHAILPRTTPAPGGEPASTSFLSDPAPPSFP